MSEKLERLTPVEAERVIAILEDSTEKIVFLDRITPDVLQHRDELSKFIGDEISRTMTEQKYLEKRYQDLIEQRSSMKGMVNKTKYKEIQEEIQDVSRALRESTNNLVRNLKENPNVSGNLIKVQRDRMELNDLLLRTIQELRDRGTYYTLTSKVNEEKNSRKKFQQLKIRERDLRETVLKLEKQLTEENQSFQRTVANQKQAISRLKEELSNVKGSTSVDAKFKRRESLAHVSSVWREFKLKERELEDKAKDFEDKMQTENIVHNETKEFLIRKHKSLVEEVASWESKYEKDVGEMDEKIQEITAKRKNLLEMLTTLQNRKQAELEEEINAKAKATAEAKAKREAERLAKRQNKAASCIQYCILAYVRRCKELEAIRGGGKKGKGGKGKGKGKKGKKK